MSLNTARDRLSMVAIPGISTLPLPHGALDSRDRLHLLDVFGSRTPFTPGVKFWRSIASENGPWASDGDAGQLFVGTNGPASAWVPAPDVDD